MFYNLRRHITTVLLLAMLSISVLSASSPSKEHNLTDVQLNAFLGIITNFILSDDTSAPVFTNQNNVLVNENQTVALNLVTSDSSPVTYSIAGEDALSFDINSLTGAVTFIVAPDFETQSSYTFTAIAIDSFGNEQNQTIVINVVNLNDNAPTISFATDNFIWAEHRVSVSQGGLTTFAIDNMNGDNNLDFIVGNDSPDNILLLTNDGNMSFSETNVTTSRESESVITVDLDGDGDIDIVSAEDDSGSVLWYDNDGNQTFTEHTISSNANGAFSVNAIDVDGDGDIDVLSASTNDNKIAWYENDGNQTFIEHNISINALGANCVNIADVDGDGDIDVLSASMNDNKVAWYENDGNQTFTEHNISTNALGAYFVTTADIDGDGVLEILSTSVNDHKIAWYKNDGNESFTEYVVSTSVLEPHNVFVRNMNNGEPNIISASYNTDEIVWFETIRGVEVNETPILITSAISPQLSS